MVLSRVGPPGRSIFTASASVISAATGAKNGRMAVCDSSDPDVGSATDNCTSAQRGTKATGSRSWKVHIKQFSTSGICRPTCTPQDLKDHPDQQIVRTEIKNQFSSQYDREKEQEAYVAMAKSAVAPSSPPSPKEIVVTRAFEQIPKDRDREIFYTYWFFYEEMPSGNAKKLPDDVYDNLARRYNTTRDNVRQIISRCKKLVKDYIAQNTKI